METISYPSTTTGVDRRARVYLPAGYSSDISYPVVYVMHGIGGDENEWQRNANPQATLDHLIADAKAVPFIAVFPNGRAMNPDNVPSNPFTSEAVAAFAAFTDDLFNDLIPYMEATYSISSDRTKRAICGLSMDGGQALNIGLGHPESFAYVGAFSHAPGVNPNTFALDDADLWPSIYILCGDNDDLLSASQNTHTWLTDRSIPHVWRTMPGGHDWPVWKRGLEDFAQIVFK